MSEEESTIASGDAGSPGSFMLIVCFPCQFAICNGRYTPLPCDLLESSGWRENTSKIFGSKGFAGKI
jgi:hypothetical protein